MILRLKYIILIVVMGITGFFTAAIAQGQGSKKFFIYIQNENGTPFYVREKDNTLLSSTHAGYIIIPQLSKGDYVFTIGLAGDQVAEAAFEVQLNGNADKGLLLREGNGQLALYSLKDFKEIQPIAVASAPGNRIVNIPSPPPAPSPLPATASLPPAGQQPEVPAEVNQPETPAPADTGGANAFTRMLDKIMGTTKKPAVAATPPQSSQTTSSGSIPNTSTTGNNPVLISSPAESNNPDSMGNAIGGNQIANSSGITQSRNAGNNLANNTTINTPPSTSSSVKNNGLQFINFLPGSSKNNSVPESPTIVNNNADSTSTPVDNLPAEVASSKTSGDTTSQIVIGNSDCQQLASEDFFQKVRRKMASRSDDEGIFRIAQKYFSAGVCFSTQQIQSLTYLFMADEYKYKFLELAYPHAYDSNHFPSLIKTLGSDYYRGRFKAMVR